MGFKKWKENTSISLSGQHLGHYKVIIKDDENGTMEKEVSPLDNLVQMTNLTIQNRFAPTRWCKLITTITTMIKKDPGSPKIETLSHSFI